MDEIKINELYLYTVNTGDLYRKVAQPIMDNLAKKIANGTYDKTKALISWQRLADQGAARYDREINDGRGSMMWIPKKEREEVAKLIQEHYEEELNEKAEKLKSEKKKSSLNSTKAFRRTAESKEEKAQALLDYLKEENLVSESLAIKDVVSVPSIEYGFKVDGKTYLVTNDEENVWMCMDIVSDKLAMKGIDWLPSSLRREFKEEYKKYSQDDNYDGDIDLDIIDALGCGELLAIDKEELELGDYLYAYLIKDDSKTSSRKPIGRFVRTERKASVLSRKALLRRRASIRRKANTIDDKKKALLKYLKEEGLVDSKASVRKIKVYDDKYFEINGMEFIVGTKDECFEYAKEDALRLYEELGFDAFGDRITRNILYNCSDEYAVRKCMEEDVKNLVDDFESEDGRIKEELEDRGEDTEDRTDEEMKDKLTEVMLDEDPTDWLINYLGGMDSDHQKGFLDYYGIINKDAMAEYLINNESSVSNELASYDGAEIDLDNDLYAYRIN